jgi:hypothetical protein
MQVSRASGQGIVRTFRLWARKSCCKSEKDRLKHRAFRRALALHPKFSNALRGKHAHGGQTGTGCEMPLLGGAQDIMHGEVTVELPEIRLVHFTGIFLRNGKKDGLDSRIFSM